MLPNLTESEQTLFDEVRETARCFCRLIESAPQLSDIELLRQLDNVLPELYWRAQRLPDIDPWADQPDDDEDSPELETPAWWHSQVTKDAQELKTKRYYEVRPVLEAILGARNPYRAVFDPVEPRTNAIEGTLSNNLAEIYEDLVEQLYLDEHAAEIPEEPVERLWHWCWSFRHHWGLMHVLPALSHGSWLVNQYWDEDDGWKELESYTALPDSVEPES